MRARIHPRRTGGRDAVPAADLRRRRYEVQSAPRLHVGGLIGRLREEPLRHSTMTGCIRYSGLSKADI